MSPPPARAASGVALLLTAATLFAVNGTASKLVLAEGGLSSLRLVEIRCVAAAAVFALLAAARRPASLRIGRRELGFVVAFGVTGIAMVQWLYFVAIARMPVSIALLVEYTAPLLVALYVRFVRGEQVRARVWAALALCLAGLALVAQVWQGMVLSVVGLLAAFGAATALATYYLLGERGLGSRDAVSLSAWTFGAAGVLWSVLLPWWTFPFAVLGREVRLGGIAGSSGVTIPIWLLVGYVVLLGTVAPFGLVLAGLHRIGPTRAGLVGTAEPVLAGLVAWLLLGEVLDAVQLLGGAVVLAGIVLAETARRGVAGPSLPYPPRGTTTSGVRARRISRDDTPPSSTLRTGP